MPAHRCNELDLKMFELEYQWLLKKPADQLVLCHRMIMFCQLPYL